MFYYQIMFFKAEHYFLDVQDRRHRRRNQGGSGEIESQREFSDTDRSEIQSSSREDSRG